MTIETPSQPNQSAQKPVVTELTQELRLATTMTGGVSLAVWMAGVAREMNLLAQASQWRKTCPDDSQPPDAPSRASRELYKNLIDLLDMVVDVDILSGTSAGGINAALLASSRVTGADLGGLRDLWLDLGALSDLLRDPTDKNTPSLLYGDKRMFAVLAKELPRLAKGPFEAPKDPPPTTLYVTTTLLSGEASQFTDSFGTLVQDVDRRGLFTFTETDLAETDQAQSETAAALALAARSSASFPVAFEPSFVPFRDKVLARGGVPSRPKMDAYANITRPHWVADGGLLDNQPIDVLLKRIFDSRAERRVRRVLLFVVPSSGPGPELSEEIPVDDVNEPLGLVDGLLKDLSAVTTQSISADLRAIRAHQDRMEARTDTRLRLAEVAKGLERLLTKSLLKDYTTREATKQTHALTAALLRELGTWPPASSKSPGSIPVKWEKQLAIGGDAEKVCRQKIKDTLLAAWRSEELPENTDGLAQYGQPALDLAKACALSIVQAAYQLAKPEQADTADPAQTDMEKLADLSRGIHDACKPPVVSNGEAEKQLPPADFGKLVRELCKDQESLKSAAGKLAEHYLSTSTVVAQAWEDLAAALAENCDTLLELVSNAPSDGEAPTDSLIGQRREAADALDKYLAYLMPKVNSESRQKDPKIVARKLFDLAVTQRAMLPAEADIEQSLELVQVSADTRSLFAPNFQTAQQKLTGMQFHHFGAFYKRSWRANDWMWGRLDGAGWLVHVLLDPRHVRWIVERAGIQRGGRAQWFRDKLRKLVPKIPDDGYPLVDAVTGVQQSLTDRKVLDELEFLDHPSMPIPPSLPLTSLWVARAWQQLVLDEELDGLAKSVTNPQPGKTPDWSPTKSRTWAEKVQARDGAAKYALLNENPVAGETFDTDKGSPLMAHTITKAAATASAAAGSVRQLPGVLKPPVVTLQTLALGGYRVVSLNKGVARSSIIFGALLLVLGIAFAIQSVAILGVTGLAVAGIGAYLVVLGTWQVSTRLLFALLSATVVLAMVALTFHVVRDWLFGTDKDHSGVVGAHVYWLGTQWWHPLIVIGAIAAAIILVAAAKPSRRTRTGSASSTIAGAALFVIGVAGVVKWFADGRHDTRWFAIGSLIVALIGGYLFVHGIRRYLSWTLIRQHPIWARIRQYWSWRRIRQYFGWLLFALLLMILLSAVLSLAKPCVREWLIGTGKDYPGLIGTPVYWLGAQGWHPLAGVIILVAIVLALALTVIAAVRRSRKERR
jgi:patatin-related protein